MSCERCQAPDGRIRIVPAHDGGLPALECRDCRGAVYTKKGDPRTTKAFDPGPDPAWMAVPLAERRDWLDRIERAVVSLNRGDAAARRLAFDLDWDQDELYHLWQGKTAFPRALRVVAQVLDGPAEPVDGHIHEDTMAKKTAMPYASRVLANLKGFPAEGVILTRKHLFHGRVGAGKSRVLDAITLAAGGYVANLAGRDVVRQGAELMSLAPGRAGMMFAEVSWSDGPTSHWECSTEAGSKKPQHTGARPQLLALTELTSELTAGPERAHRYLLAGAGAISEQDVLDRLPLDQREAYTSSRPADIAPVEALLAVRERATTRRSNEMRSWKAATQLVKNLSQGLGARPTEDQIKQAHDMAASRQNILNQQRRADALREALRVLEPKRDALRAQVANAPKVYTREQRQRAKAMDVLLTTMIERHAQTCGLCTSPVDIEAIKVRYETELLPRIEAILAPAPEGSPAADLQTTEALIAKHIAELREIGSPVDLVDELDVAAPDPFDLSTRANQWEQVDRARMQESQSAKAMNAAGQLVEACDAAIEQLVDAAAASLVERANKHMPAGMTFGLRLRDGTRQVVQFGLVDGDGTLLTGLSAGQWSIVTAALAAALGGDAVLLLDVAMHPDDLRDTMAALADWPGQVILCNPVKHSGRAPAGWTVEEVVR